MMIYYTQILLHINQCNKCVTLNNLNKYKLQKKLFVHVHEHKCNVTHNHTTKNKYIGQIDKSFGSLYKEQVVKINNLPL